VTNQDEACKIKRMAVFAILDSLCDLIKEKDKKAFYCLYWALKTYGHIAMDFKDLKVAQKVFRRLKNEC